MIPKAREVRLKPKVRKALEARCRAPTRAQRDVRRARIVLLAADGHSTRSTAEEVGVQSRIVSNWRRRFADHGLGGLLALGAALPSPPSSNCSSTSMLSLQHTTRQPSLSHGPRKRFTSVGSKIAVSLNSDSGY